MSCLQDEMVPSTQMFKLHAAQRSTHCELEVFKEASHMDAYSEEPELYWSSLARFLACYVDDAGGGIAKDVL